MNRSYSNRDNEPSVRSVLRDDIRHVNFLQDLKREYNELIKFYISDDKKKRLKNMSRVGRFVHEILWIFKSMFVRLTPIRRLFVLFGFILLITSYSITIRGENVSTTDYKGLLGGLLILFVLILELKDKLLAKDELEAGRKLQQALMPEKSPAFSGWSIWLFTRSANEVGGDLVDYLKINDNVAGITLADVAGKGLKAALLTAKLQASIRAIAYDYESLSDMGSRLHQIFHRDSLPGMFASMVYVKLCPDYGNLKFINAGHLPPVLINNDGTSELFKGEPALGLMQSYEYTEREISLKQGDVFIAFSDGVTEAQNVSGDFFGTARLYKMLPQVKDRNAEGIGQAIVSYVDNFVGESPAFDDLSVVILKKI